MVERRSLVEGLKPAAEVVPAVEKRFVFGDKAEPEKPSGAGEGPKGRDPVGRAPLTIRVRTDYATALKRASLERQLAGTVPSTIQDILEEALEPWLRAHGYVT